MERITRVDEVPAAARRAAERDEQPVCRLVVRRVEHPAQEAVERSFPGRGGPSIAGEHGDRDRELQRRRGGKRRARVPRGARARAEILDVDRGRARKAARRAAERPSGARDRARSRRTSRPSRARQPEDVRARCARRGAPLRRRSRRARSPRAAADRPRAGTSRRGEAQPARDRAVDPHDHAPRACVRHVPRRRRTRPGTRPAARSRAAQVRVPEAGRRSRANRSLDRAVPILAHLDLDAFFAAVEELEDPSLRTRPLVVGGDPHGRGVVATANYVARRFGIRSAMSSAEALRRCPEVVFVRPRHALYRQYSQAVWACVEEVVPRVERTGIDEGYLDLGSVLDSFAGARRLAEAVQVAVRGSTSLSCSLGVSTSKVVCKIASDRRKPGGITVVPPGSGSRIPRAAARPGSSPASGRARRSASRPRASRRSAASRRCRTPSFAPCSPARSAGSSATAHAASTRATSSSTRSGSRSRPRRRSSAT